MELTKNEIINNVVDELDRAVDMLKPLYDSDSINLCAKQELISDMEADRERLMTLLDDEPEYERISLENFKRLKQYDEICVRLNGELINTRLSDNPFYNCDADESDWEVETPIGTICWDSVYIPVESTYSLEVQFIKWIKISDRSFVISKGKERYRFIQERVGDAKLVYLVSQDYYDVGNSSKLFAITTDEVIYLCNQSKMLKFDNDNCPELELLSSYQEEVDYVICKSFLPTFLDLQGKSSSTSPRELRKIARKKAFYHDDEEEKFHFAKTSDCIALLCGFVTIDQMASCLLNAHKKLLEDNAINENIIKNLISSDDFIASWERRLFDTLINLPESVAVVELELYTISVTTKVTDIIEALIYEKYLPSTHLRCNYITKVKHNGNVIFEL